jgi:hypothetical protein
LPTIRAISRRVGAPVDLTIAWEFRTILPLLTLQPYLRVVLADPAWTVHPDHPHAPSAPAAALHLGYRGWPEPDVLRHTIATANEALIRSGRSGISLTVDELTLANPWITLPSEYRQDPTPGTDWVAGFSDTHFELKYGVWRLLMQRTADAWWRTLNLSCGSRWQTEGHNRGCGWLAGAQRLAHTRVLLADCSAWHVLAVAMGVPTVLLEPMEARWNPIFYPLGQDGPQVTLVRGTDARPTFDARHVADTLTRMLETP